MKLFPWRTGEGNVKFDGDDVNESIIDQLSRTPVPYGGDWSATVPMTVIPRPPAPPSRHARPELHVTPPQGVTPPVQRPSRGRVLQASRATLPVFHKTAHIVGWRAFILPKKPVTAAAAIRAINVYTERTNRVTCQQTEVAKGELWERARDYDRVEAQLRARRPVGRKQVSM